METMVGLICKYMTTIGENVCEGKIKLDKFIMFKVNLYCKAVTNMSVAEVTGEKYRRLP